MSSPTSSSLQCRSQWSSRGRPQRCAQGQFREAARTPSARFGSRGSSVSARSRSGTRCRRPSAEVELRAELGATLSTFAAEAESPEPANVDGCASGFVCDLIDDAVDDFADDLVHDVDDVHPSSPASVMTTVKAVPIIDAMLVLSAGEPAITEEVEEDEDICAAAALFTARSVEEAISSVAPGSPNWSLRANAPSYTSETTPVNMRQLDLSMADEDSDCSSCDDYEEVYSLASEDDEQDSDDEIEAMAYVKMAVDLARTAVSKGCSEAMAEETDDEESETEETPVDLDEAKAAARDALCAALLGEPRLLEVDAQAETEEKCVEFLGEGPSCSGELAFDFASDILDGAFTTLVQEDKDEAQDDEEDLETLRLMARETLSKAIQTGQLSVALGATRPPPEPETTPEPTIESLKARVRETLLKAAAQKTSEIETLKAKARDTLLKAASLRGLGLVDQVQKEDSSRMLKEKAKETLLKAARNGTLLPSLKTVRASVKEESSRMLREKAKETLLKAARDGKLMPSLKTVREAAQTKALKEKVRSTLCMAIREGRLTTTLQEVAPKTPNIESLRQTANTALTQALTTGKFEGALREIMHQREIKQKKTEEGVLNKVKNVLKQGLQSGQLSKLFTARQEKDRWEALRSKMQSTFIEGAATGQLGHALSKVLAGSKEVESQPLPPACVMPAPPAEIASTPIRRRRSLIIGGVTRNPALQPDLEMPSASPMSSPWSDSTSVRKRHSKSSRKSKEGPDAFRLDLGDLAEISDRPASKAGARLRAASTSAMAMDLGLGGTSSSHTSSPWTSDQLASFRQQIAAPKAFSLEQKMRPSASLPSLQAPRASKGLFLPTLASEKKSAESIAWTMHMSKNTAKWCNTGLRGSASMVF